MTPRGSRIGIQLGWPARVAALIAVLAAAWVWAQASPPAGLPTPPAAPVAQAAPPTPPAAPDLVEVTPNLKDLFYTSPYINGAILGLSVVSVLMFLYFLFTMNLRTMMPAEFVDDVTKLILAKRYDEAAQLCRNNRRIFAASIIQRCVENAGKEHSVILSMLDAEGQRRSDVAWNRLSYLADVINVAPMLGLLGTVLGLMTAFFTFRQQEVSLGVASGALTTSIGGAMTTTFFGLIVAIVSLVFYSIVKARLTRTLSEVEQTVHSIADHIKRGIA